MMTEQQPLPENEHPEDTLVDEINEIDDAPPADESVEMDFEDLPPLPPGFDIDAALAAVGSLSDVIAEHEAEEAAEHARLEALRQAEEERLEAKRREEEEYARWVASYDFARPPLTKLQRGQPASVIPALLLMLSGAYLTFTLTLSQTPPEPRIVLLIVCGVVGLTLLSHWISSGRWARGALFAGLAVLFGGASIFYLTLPNNLNTGSGLPLLVVALGLATLFSVLLSRPIIGRLIPVGLALIVGGGVMLGFTMGLLEPAVLTLISQFWYVPLIVVAVLMLTPVVVRKRG
jgi:hypothetical protein